MPRWRLVQIWDIVAVVLLFPVVVLVGSQLPGDWRIHNGSGVPGTGTVVAVEPVRGGTHILVDVADAAGRTIARRQEVNGDASQVLGARFPVTYLSRDDRGDAQVYVAGHDPFTTNLLVFVPCLAVWVTGLFGVGARLWRLGRRWFSRNRPRRTGPYRAGHGYPGE